MNIEKAGKEKNDDNLSNIHEEIDLDIVKEEPLDEPSTESQSPKRPLVDEHDYVRKKVKYNHIQKGDLKSKKATNFTYTSTTKKIIHPVKFPYLKRSLKPKMQVTLDSEKNFKTYQPAAKTTDLNNKPVVIDLTESEGKPKSIPKSIIFKPNILQKKNIGTPPTTNVATSSTTTTSTNANLVSNIATQPVINVIQNLLASNMNLIPKKPNEIMLIQLQPTIQNQQQILPKNTGGTINQPAPINGNFIFPPGFIQTTTNSVQTPLVQIVKSGEFKKLPPLKPIETNVRSAIIANSSKSTATQHANHLPIPVNNSWKPDNSSGNVVPPIASTIRKSSLDNSTIASINTENADLLIQSKVNVATNRIFDQKRFLVKKKQIGNFPTFNRLDRQKRILKRNFPEVFEEFKSSKNKNSNDVNIEELGLDNKNELIEFWEFLCDLIEYNTKEILFLKKKDAKLRSAQRKLERHIKNDLGLKFDDESEQIIVEDKNLSESENAIELIDSIIEKENSEQSNEIIFSEH